MNIIFDLFLTFAKVGLFTFGGGYAMIALIESTCVEKKKWISHDEMMNITVIAESTPGPIAINCAPHVGYKQKGFAGASIATIGMILSSFCIIFTIVQHTWNSMAILIVMVFFLILITAGTGVIEEYYRWPARAWAVS